MSLRASPTDSACAERGSVAGLLAGIGKEGAAAGRSPSRRSAQTGHAEPAGPAVRGRFGILGSLRASHEPMNRFLLPALLVLVTLEPAGAQHVVPATPGTYGPFPCAVTTLVALPDQAAALNLTPAQADTLRALREIHLDAVHETLGEVGTLVRALHALGKPHDTAETFALFYDLGAHYAELDDDFHIAEASLLGVLSDEQRARWAPWSRGGLVPGHRPRRRPAASRQPTVDERPPANGRAAGGIRRRPQARTGQSVAWSHGAPRRGAPPRPARGQACSAPSPSTQASGVLHELGPVREPQLRLDPRAVALDRLDREVEPLRDLARRDPAARHLEHLELAVGEGLERRERRGPCRRTRPRRASGP